LLVGQHRGAQSFGKCAVWYEWIEGESVDRSVPILNCGRSRSCHGEFAELRDESDPRVTEWSHWNWSSTTVINIAKGLNDKRWWKVRDRTTVCGVHHETTWTVSTEGTDQI
jgi:hypothetical protein